MLRAPLGEPLGPLRTRGEGVHTVRWKVQYYWHGVLVATSFAYSLLVLQGWMTRYFVRTAGKSVVVTRL